MASLGKVLRVPFANVHLRMFRSSYPTCAGQRHLSRTSKIVDNNRLQTFKVPTTVRGVGGGGGGRSYSDKTGRLSASEVKSRVLNVCRAYDKVTADKVSLESHFINDLGLDSLDHVEVIMAIEDEFGFEIPDEDAEKLHRPKDIVQYVCDREDIYD